MPEILSNEYALICSIFQVEVTELSERVTSTFFLFSDEKPYWFDIETLLVEFKPMAEEAFASLKTAGDKWINERVDDAEDIVKKFTKGKTTLVGQMFNKQKLPHYLIDFPQLSQYVYK